MIEQKLISLHVGKIEKEGIEMPLDPQVQSLLDMMKAMNAPEIQNQTVEEARQSYVMLAQMGGSSEKVAKVEDRAIPGPAGDIPVRIYTPEGQGPHPMLMFFHGGGWVIGNIEGYDGLCRQFTNKVPCIVVSVEYRLAPEYPFPAAPEDCYAATKWVAENAASINGDAARIAVGGDSAGGNLSAVVSLMAKEQDGPKLALQVLIYPATDYYLPGTPSIIENGKDYFLTRDAMIWFTGHYFRSGFDRDDWRAFPLRAKDLQGLPPALIIAAEYDPLRDEGELYAGRLREANVPVQLSLYDGMIHGFMSMSSMITRTQAGIEECATALRKAFQ